MKPGEASQCFWKLRSSRETRHAIFASPKQSKNLKAGFPQKKNKKRKEKMKLAQKIHETGFFICLFYGLEQTENF